mgnify:CR=1 FL=1
MLYKYLIRKVTYRSYTGDIGKIAPNIINWSLYAESPNKKWTSDIPSTNRASKKLYLSPLHDV